MKPNAFTQKPDLSKFLKETKGTLTRQQTAAKTLKQPTEKQRHYLTPITSKK